jgi:hypothetical protein
VTWVRWGLVICKKKKDAYQIMQCYACSIDCTRVHEMSHGLHISWTSDWTGCISVDPTRVLLYFSVLISFSVQTHNLQLHLAVAGFLLCYYLVELIGLRSCDLDGSQGIPRFTKQHHERFDNAIPTGSCRGDWHFWVVEFFIHLLNCSHWTHSLNYTDSDWSHELWGAGRDTQNKKIPDFHSV